MEHADIMGRQELHKLGIAEGVLLAVKYGRHLARDVQDLPRNQGHGHDKHILERRTGLGCLRWTAGQTDGETGRSRPQEVRDLRDLGLSPDLNNSTFPVPDIGVQHDGI